MIHYPADYLQMLSAGLLATVWIGSGLAKVNGADGILIAMNNLGVPTKLHRRWVACLLPAIEILFGGSLIFASDVALKIFGSLSFFLLSYFTALLWRAWRSPEAVECGCFGVLAGSKITGWSVLRNVLLLLGAALVVLGAKRDRSLLETIINGSTEIRLGLLCGWLLTAVLVLLVSKATSQSRPVGKTARLLSRRGDVPPMSELSIALGIDPRRPGEVRIGEPIPDSELVGLGGQVVQLSHVGAGQPVMLVFLSADCGSCDAVGREVVEWSKQITPVKLRVLTSSHPDDMESKFPGIRDFLLFGSRSAIKELGVQRTPSAVALGGNHQPIMASSIAYGLLEIEGLVAALKSQ